MYWFYKEEYFAAVTAKQVPRLWSNQVHLHCRPQARTQKRPPCWQALQRSQSRRQPAKAWKPARPIRKLWRLLQQAQTHPAPAHSPLSPLQQQSRAPLPRQVGCRGAPVLQPCIHCIGKGVSLITVCSCLLFPAMCYHSSSSIVPLAHILSLDYILYVPGTKECPQPSPG